MTALASTTASSSVQLGSTGSNNLALCGAWEAVVIAQGGVFVLIFFRESKQQYNSCHYYVSHSPESIIVFLCNTFSPSAHLNSIGYIFRKCKKKKLFQKRKCLLL